MQRWTSDPLELTVDPAAPFSRVDLEFEEVSHDGDSYVALVYLNNPRANARTGRDESKGFVCGFTVFGHGVCWGVDDEHCAVRDPVSPFDRRPEHRLTPQNVTLDVTEAVNGLGDVDELMVTVVATSTGDSRKPLRFSELTLVAYQ
jgi:hypothetical protein